MQKCTPFFCLRFYHPRFLGIRMELANIVSQICETTFIAQMVSTSVSTNMGRKNKTKIIW